MAFADEQRTWVDAQLRRIDRARRARPAPMSLPEMRTWRRRAEVELPARLLALAQAHALRVSRVSVKNQRARWGSCSRGGHICLNWRLVLMPDWVSDYVLIHELMHLKRLDHSGKFWKLVARACPRFEEARAWLRAHEHFLDADG
jgi:predicted metal-dependent hydrolase